MVNRPQWPVELRATLHSPMRHYFGHSKSPGKGSIAMRITALLMFVALPLRVHAAVVSAPNVEVNYSGIDQDQAQAIANTLSAARGVYADDFGLDMPSKITCEVTCGAGNPTRLYTDGSDRV